jgi:alpha-D-ribose 1-methylphosphonate 5-triphosphate synthase subunit PhnG
MHVKLFTTSEKRNILVILKQSASGNLEQLWEIYLDSWFLVSCKTGLKKIRAKVGNLLDAREPRVAYVCIGDS